jgi:hypothetical protein
MSGREIPGDASAEFPRGVGDFLVSLALAAHRYAMYPSNHPSLRSTLESAVREVSRVLQDRGALAVAARGGRLIVDQVVSDPENRLLGDLARRMEEHRLGSLVFRKGVTVEEMGGVLDSLSRDPQHPESALGLLPVQERPSWEHALLQPLGYDFPNATEFTTTAAGRPAIEVWQALEERLEDAREAEGAQSADARAALETVGHMVRLLDDLGWDRGPEAERARKDFESTILDFPRETLSRLISLADRTATDGETRPSQRLLVVLSRSELAPGVVARIAEAMAEAEHPALSESLPALLARLAELAGESRGAPAIEASSAIRRVLERRVISARGQDAPGAPPGAWRASPSDTAGATSPPMDRPLSLEEANRVLEIALEVDRGGAVLEVALRRLLRSGDVARAFELADGAPAESRVAREIEDFLVEPDNLRILLSGDDVDEAGLAAMVDRLGDRALDPLFDRLAGSESRTIRRKIFDRLTAMGDRVSATVMNYLEDPPWFVQRNMLALLLRMPTLPAGFSPLQHLAHDDARVRREALPLALRVPGARDEALRLGLADSDERIVRMTLLELQDGVPDAVVPTLIEKGLRDPVFPELSSLAARALGFSGRPEARDALMAAAVEGEGDEMRIAPAGPAVLAALVSLRERWGDDPVAAPILERAEGSSDPRVRSAASGPPGGRP